MRIDEIWEEQENDMSCPHGILYKRYSSSIIPDICVGMQFPEKFRCIAIFIDSGLPLELASFSNLRDISVELLPGASEGNKKTLIFKLLDYHHQDIFAVLCEDLIESTSQVTNESLLVKEILNRFGKWKSLFDRVASHGLSPEEQRGLFGELLFLRKFLKFNSDFHWVISTWEGPEHQARDFKWESWAVEVKTSYGNKNQSIHISSENQLETHDLDNLILYHIFLEGRHHSGESLNDLVKSIQQTLESDISSANKFKSKLLEAGYFDHHKNLYADLYYIIRGEDYYQIENEFPRIEASEIRNGVSDVKYTILVAICSDFRKTEEEVFKLMREI